MMVDATIDAAATQLGRDHTARFTRRMPNQGAQPEQIENPPQISNGFARMVFLLSGFAVVFAVLILAAVQYLGNEIAKGGYSDSQELHQILVGNDVISVPSNIVRFPAQRKSASQDKLELFFHWPTMQGYSSDLKPYFVKEAKQDKILFVSLEPKTMPAEMSGRVENVYTTFFDGPAMPTNYGLIRQPLNPESGYLDEDLLLEPNSPYPFVARCLRARVEGSKPYCIRDIHIGKDMMATIRFHNSLLPDWMKLDQLVRNQLNWMLSR